MSLRNNPSGGILDYIGLSNWRYERLNNGGNSQQARPKKKFLKLGGVTVLASLVLLIMFQPWPENFTMQSTTHESSKEPFPPTEIRSNNLHLLIPASSKNIGLCKTIFSAAALDYPTPRIINWDKEFKDSKMSSGGSHLGKIKGVFDFLQSLGPEFDNDLALMVDGLDVWFQLRPETLIERYHKINERANRRIRQRMGAAPTHVNGIEISQRIILSSQKKCWPSEREDPECYAVPESTLPTHVYGQETDQLDVDPANPYNYVRQKYLNSGFIMGPIKDLRDMFEKAIVYIKFSPSGSDQRVFAKLFGEQEYTREALRAEHMAEFVPGGDLRDEIANPDHKLHRPNTEDGDRFEFGMGLDYFSELGQPTVFCEEDLAWLRYDSTPTELEQIAKAAGFAGESPKVSSLPYDVLHAPAPFAGLNSGDGENFFNKSWTQVPLFTNLWTGVTPVTVHHNAHRDGLKNRIRTMWNETFYFPHLRTILSDKAHSPRRAVAIFDGPHVREEWWSPVTRRGGVEIETGKWPGDFIKWDEICGDQETADQIFRDGKQPWKNPE
ncbi:hypothetical protein B0A52_10386 [Exophiala mesophila]|uniref:Uncharacterized protein n=1 Tax=Exophiala mesophila TaxID=212818 RepID=A0A438MQ95_EXOME|nr:hypothetical protein B0A52_10386 [Exophiala mesophila]